MIPKDKLWAKLLDLKKRYGDKYYPDNVAKEWYETLRYEQWPELEKAIDKLMATSVWHITLKNVQEGLKEAKIQSKAFNPLEATNKGTCGACGNKGYHFLYDVDGVESIGSCGCPMGRSFNRRAIYPIPTVEEMHRRGFRYRKGEVKK